MRVLVVMDAIGTGGISSAFINFVKELGKRVDCDILIFDEDSISQDDFPQYVNIIKSNWPLKILGMPQSFVKKKSKIWAFLRIVLVIISRIFNGNYARRILLLFAKKLKGYDVAISYAQDVGWKTLARGCNDYVLYNVNSKIKCAYIHCDYRMFGGYHRNQEKMYGKFNYIFCVSAGCRSSFVKCFPTLDKKAIIMENFTDVAAIHAKSLESNVPKKKCKNIITICRISEEKGIHRALNVIEKLKSEGYIFCWTIVGNGEDYNFVEKMIEDKHITEYVELVGMKKNPFPYLLHADVFLLPSFHEAAPMVFGECWVLGIPIITTETSSAREMVEDQKIGFVCDNSQDGLYKVLKDFLDDKLDFYALSGLKNNNVNKIPSMHLERFLNAVRCMK